MKNIIGNLLSGVMSLIVSDSATINFFITLPSVTIYDNFLCRLEVVQTVELNSITLEANQVVHRKVCLIKIITRLASIIVAVYTEPIKKTYLYQSTKKYFCISAAIFEEDLMMLQK